MGTKAYPENIRGMLREHGRYCWHVDARAGGLARGTS